MRCEECGRIMKNAQMWQLGGAIDAPMSRSMRQLCWECRERAAAGTDALAEAPDAAHDILAQAYEIVREYESRSV